MVAAAVADGQPALAITDHGNMYGVLDFYKECREPGVTPIIGTEAYMAAQSRYDRPVRRGRIDDTGGEGDRGEKLYYHLTLLAETTAGYRNLMKLSSAAYLEGYYYKPRVDWELLERYHDGAHRHDRLPRWRGAPGAPGRGFRRRARASPAGCRTSSAGTTSSSSCRTTGSPPSEGPIPISSRSPGPSAPRCVATNDSHYCRREDAVAHDALLCVQTGATIDDPKRFKFEGQEHYLKTAAEMRHLFAEVPEACDNTLWIAERANVEIELGKPALPEFPIPDGFRRDTYEESRGRRTSRT